MQSLAIGRRWLALCAAIAAVLLAVSVSTGMAFGNSSSEGGARSGFGRSGQGTCTQIGSGGSSFAPSQVADPAGAIAAALNLTRAELQQRIASGESLSQVVSDAGMSARQVGDAAIASLKDQLDQQVAAGRFPLNQESEMPAALRAQIDDILAGKAALDAPGPSIGITSRGFNERQGGGRFNPCGG